VISGDDLAAWGDVIVLGSVQGGARNDLVRVEVNGRRCIARRGTRLGETLEWEVELLLALHERGIGVPKLVAAEDGRLSVGPVIVMEAVEGSPLPERRWPEVAAALRRVHAATTAWPQRPGFVSSADLLTIDRGGDVDLAAMPSDAAERCRQAWALLPEMPHTAVHGDPNPRNVIAVDGDVVLIDWDEARVDHPWLDLGALGSDAGRLPSGQADVACRAATAWEVATCWQQESHYARQRLEELG
jgi:aminoglycoside phosphotransferase (APT) family kinase protein